MIDGQCVLPSEESCKLLGPKEEWAFDEWTCKPVCKSEYQKNCANAGKIPPCTSDRTACFNQDENLCDPSGWECTNTRNF